MTLYKPRVGPGLTAANSSLLTVSAAGIYSLTAGTDYRVTFNGAALGGRVWLIGGRNVHVGWGATPIQYGGQISLVNDISNDGVSCLIVEDMEGSCTIEGMTCLKNGGHGHCFQIRCTTTSFPVTVLNCWADGALPNNPQGGGSALSVRNGTCPSLTVDGFTFRTFGTGISFGPTNGGTYQALDLRRVNGTWGNDPNRLIGTLIELPATASLFETYLTDEANPTASILPLISGGSGSVDPAGGIKFPPGSVDGTVFPGQSTEALTAAETGIGYVQPGYESGVAPPTTAGRLAWHPEFTVPLTSPTPYLVTTSGGERVLAAGEQLEVTLPASQVNGFVRFVGVAGSGNRVRIKGGGAIKQLLSSASQDATCLKFSNVDYIYAEGLKLDKANAAGDAINITGAFKLAIIQNCLGVGINYADTALGHAFTNHGEFLDISTADGGTLLMDLCTFYTWRDGIALSNAHLLAGTVLRRVNGHANDPATNPIAADANAPLFVFQDVGCAVNPTPIWLDQVFAQDDKPVARALLSLVAPSSTYGQVTCGANFDSVNNVVTWPASTRIEGQIANGGGDFVAATFTGLGYQTPGYDGVPLPDIERGAIAVTLDHVPTILELINAARANRGLAPLTALEIDDAFPHAQTEGAGVAVDGAWYDQATRLVIVPGEPPAPWQPLTAAAFSFDASTFNVGDGIAIPFNAFGRDALFDPRSVSLPVSAVGSAVGCTVTLDINSVTVTPSQQTPVSFSFTLSDSRAQTSTATCTLIGVQPAVVTPPPSSSYALKYFGAPWLSGSLGNNNIKGSGAGAAYTFRAPKTGSIKGFRWFLVAKIVDASSNSGVNYGFGNGGTARGHMETNGSGNIPSGTWVGGTSNYDQMAHFIGNDTPWTQHDTFRNSRNNGYPYFTFPTPCAVVKDTTYHLVFKNVDADPSNNWFSVDNQDTHNPGNPSLPSFPDTDWGFLYLSGGNWIKRADGYFPICQIEYTDGFAWGCPTNDNWNGYYLGTQETFNGLVTTSQWVREKAISPPVTINVTHLNVVATVASGSGNFIADLLDANDQVIESVTWASSALSATKHNWAGRKQLSQPRLLQAGTAYRLRYRSTGGSYNIYSLNRTTDQGTNGWDLPSLQANNYVDPGWINNTRQGWAQVSTNSGSTWSDINGQRDAHLTYYFTPVAVPPAPTPGLAFPGALGFGATATGGRGGTIYHVTTLADSGAGSFRTGITNSGARTIVFDVGGTINLASRIVLSNPLITIAGETAPSPGIEIVGNQFSVRTNNVICRHISFRSTLISSTGDSMEITNGDAGGPVIFDHCTFQWGGDGTVDIWSDVDLIKNVTLQDCFVFENLAGKNLIIKGSQGITLYRTYMAYSNERHPRIHSGDPAQGMPFIGPTLVEVLNCCSYNGAGFSGSPEVFLGNDSAGACPVQLSFINNWYIAGANTVTSNPLVKTNNGAWGGDATQTKIYLSGNGNPNGRTTFTNQLSFNPIVTTPPVSSGIPASSLMAANAALETDLLLRGGSRPNDRDTYTVRTVNKIIGRTGTNQSSLAGFGGHSNLASTSQVFVPVANPNGDDDNDGWTNLEEQLHALSAALIP